MLKVNNKMQVDFTQKTVAVNFKHPIIVSIINRSGYRLKRINLRERIWSPMDKFCYLLAQPTRTFLVEFYWRRRETDASNWHVVAGEFCE